MSQLMRAFFCRSVCVAAISLAPAGIAYAQTAGTISGTVVDEGSGEFLPGAVVRIEGTEFQAMTESDGSYRFSGVAPGTYQLTVSYVGYVDYEAAVTIGEDGEAVHPIVLKPDAATGSDIVVRGYLFGTGKALNDQKESANIKNVISEEMIASFPDLNTAEALQRVPGVQIQRDNGEGRFVSIRGTSPRMTAVTINGEQVAFSNTSTRAVELDVVSAAQLSGIEVTKVITPDMEATAIGGAIDLRTRGAFDYKRQRVVADAGVGQNSIAEGRDFRVSANYSNVFGDVLGVSLGVNFARTNTERHSLEARWEDVEDVDGNELPYAFLEASTLYSKNVRDRLGLNGRLDFRPSDNTSLFISAVYNLREDDQDRQILRHRFDRGDYLSADAVEGARAVMALHDRLEKQQITFYSAGGEQFIGDATLEFLVSRSEAFTKKDAGQLRPEFEIRNIDYAFSDLDSRRPQWTVTNDADLSDGDDYRLNVLDLRYEDTTSKSDTVRVDFTKPMTLGSDTGTIKVGAKVNWQHKIRADVRTQYTWDGGGSLTLTPFLSSNEDYMLENGYSAGPRADREAFREFWENNLSSFEPTERSDVNLGEPYDAKESVTSVYGMTTQEYGNLLVLAGVRAEFRKNDYTATQLVLETNEDTGTDGAVILNELVNSKRDYHHIFPNLQFRYRIGDDTNIRAAYSKGLALPDFFDITPYSLTQVEIEDGEIDGSIVRGNPDLEPAVSHNFDLLGEHFFPGLGLLSAGIFYKSIDDFTYLSQYDEPSGPYEGFEVSQFANGASAKLWGLEFSWQQQFRFLPGWLDGFGIYANYTYTGAFDIDLGPDSNREELKRLPEQRQHVGNLALTYERGAVLSRLSMNYSGDVLEEVGANEEEDIWEDSRTVVDFSFTYKLPFGLDLYVQGNNLTDSVTYGYFGRSTRARIYSLHGRTFTVGARYTF